MRSYESAQEYRLKGALQAALPELASCARPACPAFIRNDCAAWSSAVAAELPSLSFSVTSGGRALEEVKITMDDVQVAVRVPSQPLSVDPGSHVFLFEAAGTDPVRRSVLVERGQKARIIQVELPTSLPEAIASPAPTPAASPPDSLPEPVEQQAPIDPRSLAFGVIGVGGVAGFTLLGLHAHSEENKLRTGCAPHCSAAEVSSVRSQYLMADVSLGIGLASLGVGAYLFLASRSSKLKTDAHLPLQVVVARGAASATFTGSF